MTKRKMVKNESTGWHYADVSNDDDVRHGTNEYYLKYKDLGGGFIALFGRLQFGRWVGVNHLAQLPASVAPYETVFVPIWATSDRRCNFGCLCIDPKGFIKIESCIDYCREMIVNTTFFRGFPVDREND